MATPDLRRAFQANGLENTYMEGVAVRQLIDKEQARNKAVIEQAKIKID